MQFLLPVHIAAGGAAIVLGAIALIAAKGGVVHRKIGIVFVYAMLTMGFSASLLGFAAHGITDPNVGAGWMCAYFVVTALLTVRPASVWTRRISILLVMIAIVFGSVTAMRGFTALATPRRSLGGVPAPMFFFLATIMLTGAAGDLRVLFKGPLRGAPRLARHLWRMCFALFIAAGSFFSIRARVARVLPEPFTTPTMRLLPIVLIFGAMFFWLWRVRGRRFVDRLAARSYISERVTQSA